MTNSAYILVEKVKNSEFQSELSEFYELNNIFENNKWHYETTLEHTLLVLSEYEKIIKNNKIDFLEINVSDNSKKDLLKVAILFHDISKTDTIQIKDDMTTSFPNHEEQGALKAKKILERFNFAENEIDFIVSIIKNHGIPHGILKDREKCDQMLNDLKTNISDIYYETMILAMADTMGSKLEKNNEAEYQFRINKYKSILNLK